MFDGARDREVLRDWLDDVGALVLLAMGCGIWLLIAWLLLE